jgi:hypothetical protein
MAGMERRGRHLSRPVYEGLPWLYMTGGLAGLAASYLLAARARLSLTVGLLGLAVLLGGIVVLLRRRDYRELRSHYANPEALDREEER